jgi:hypothetical protein
VALASTDEVQLRDLDSQITSLGFVVLAMLYQCVGVNVGSKTINMVGGGGINSPHSPTSRYKNSAAHGHTGQSGAPPVRQRSSPMASSDS